MLTLRQLFGRGVLQGEESKSIYVQPALLSQEHLYIRQVAEDSLHGAIQQHEPGSHSFQAASS